MNFNEQHLSQLSELISNPKKIVITPHLRPDGDAMGSILGLSLFLQKLGHDVVVISPTEIDNYLMWLVQAPDVLITPKHEEAAHDFISKAELLFCLDYSALKRVEPLADSIRNSSAPKILIDHHLDPEDFTDLQFHDVKASSTCELVFLLIEALEKKELIDAEIGEALYTGLMTDTGSFQHSNTTAEVHRIASHLIAAGVDVGKVHSLIYNNYSENRLRFLGFCLNEKMKVIKELNTSYMLISSAEMKRFHLKGGDTEGLVNYNLSMKGINFGVLIKEDVGKVKMSFRSIGQFATNKFAANFSGGGHHNASGGISFESLADTEKRFLELVNQHKDELNY